MKNIALTSFWKIVCCVTLFAAQFPLHAAEREIVFEAHPVVQVFQEQDESWDGFVSRSGRVMRDYTSKTGFEAGGWLCVHSRTRLGAMSINSNLSQISVSASMKGCPLQGYELTSEFMHSHPVKDRIVLTEKDMRGYPVSKAGRLLRGMRAGSSVQVGASGGRFSKADISIGPGYLVHGDDLHYQKDGRQSYRSSLRSHDDARTLQGSNTLLASDQRLTAQGTGAASLP